MEDDLIRRHAAIDALNEYFARIEKLKRRGLTKGEKAISLDTVGTIKTLPSAQPERKMGKWVGYNADDPVWQRDDGTPVFLECSACQAFVINNGAANWNYCPNCGADMRGEKDETD